MADAANIAKNAMGFTVSSILFSAELASCQAGEVGLKGLIARLGMTEIA